VRTDAGGKASVAFTLPDNLTSWAVTALALTDDLLAGTGLGEVPVGIPLFVDLTMNDEYLTNDGPIVRVRAFGDGLEPGAIVSYEVSSDTMFDTPIEVQGEAFESVA
jgi:hypothetical protein